ncbi:MAG: cellulase family glycosylhydrolase [bacterium]
MKHDGKHLVAVATAMLILSTTTLPTHAGNYEVDNGTIYHDTNEVRFYGVNWFGLETANHTPHGLWARSYKDMVQQIKQLGFNAVRLPFCPFTLDDAAASSIDYSLNPELQGLGGLGIMDKIIEELDSNGIYILLDHHRPDCNAISELWYTDTYSEQDWIDDLIFVAERYRNIDHFMGIDLKNEPHGAATWGTGNAATDWNRAAERAAKAILATNNNILIFVEGIEENPSCTSNINHWWGGNLEPQACYPLDIPDNKLVFSPHVYGPDVWPQPYFNDPGFPENMPAIWDQHFGFLADQERVIAPGEFGGKYGHGGEADDVDWQNAIIDYFIDKKVCNFFYWSWNPNSVDTGGILQDNWNTIWQDKYDNLNRLMAACDNKAIPECSDGLDNDNDGLTDLIDPGCENANDNSEYDTPPQPVSQCSDGIDNDDDGLVDLDDPGCSGSQDDDEYNASNPVPGNLELEVVAQSDWGTGYCADGLVINNTNQANEWAVNIQVEGVIRDMWNGEYTLTAEGVTVRGGPWNNILQPGQSTSFGFCVDRNPAPRPLPPAPTTQCSDGLDNDGDGLIDTDDPGCDSQQDNDEYNAPIPTSGLTAEFVVGDDWGAGYCGTILVRNNGTTDEDWNMVLDIEGTLRNFWNAIITQNGNQLTVEGIDWNNIVPAGGSIESAGFCADR